MQHTKQIRRSSKSGATAMGLFRTAFLLCAAIPSFAAAWQLPTPQQRQQSTVLRMSSASSSDIKVTVVGGTGFAGSRVCKLLAEKGVSVTSVSKTGRVPDWCQEEPWTKDVVWASADLLSADDAALDAAVGTPDAIVSCVGVVGTDKEELLKGNGVTNVAAFASAKRGNKVLRSVLISVADEVAACQENWLPDFFSGYFDGKKMAEKAALDAVSGDESKLCLVKPTFIYGGSSFGLLPPRVNFEYGSGVEELLFLGPFEFIADITPGLIKVALRPPVCVDSVASACAAAALGEEGVIGKNLDGTKAINAATDQPAATGLTEALKWTKENLIKAYDWAKVEVPKAIESVKDTVDKAQQQK